MFSSKISVNGAPKRIGKPNVGVYSMNHRVAKDFPRSPYRWGGGVQLPHFFVKESCGKKTPPPQMGVSEGTYRILRDRLGKHGTRWKGVRVFPGLREFRRISESAKNCGGVRLPPDEFLRISKTGENSMWSKTPPLGYLRISRIFRISKIAEFSKRVRVPPWGFLRNSRIFRVFQNSLFFRFGVRVPPWGF